MHSNIFLHFHVLGIIGCKVMGAREVLFGTHVEVVVFRMVQHSIQPDG